MYVEDLGGVALLTVIIALLALVSKEMLAKACICEDWGSFRLALVLLPTTRGNLLFGKEAVIDIMYSRMTTTILLLRDLLLRDLLLRDLLLRDLLLRDLLLMELRPLMDLGLLMNLRLLKMARKLESSLSRLARMRTFERALAWFLETMQSFQSDDFASYAGPRRVDDHGRIIADPRAELSSDDHVHC